GGAGHRTGAAAAARCPADHRTGTGPGTQGRALGTAHPGPGHPAVRRSDPDQRAPDPSPLPHACPGLRALPAGGDRAAAAPAGRPRAEQPAGRLPLCWPGAVTGVTPVTFAIDLRLTHLDYKRPKPRRGSTTGASERVGQDAPVFRAVNQPAGAVLTTGAPRS